MKRLAPILGLLIACSCTELPKSEDPPIVEGLPTMQSIADSLDSVSAQAIKWSWDPKTDSIRYAVPSDSIAWDREFLAFLRDNVNRLRYKEAYTVTDTSIGDERNVRFVANTKKQEIRLISIKLRAGKIVRYEVVKERNNLLSHSRQSFLFDGSHYELSIQQKINGVFENEQFLYASIIPQGKVYRGTFNLGDDLLPFNLVLQKGRLIVKNGTELIAFLLDEERGDSLVYQSPYFNSRFVFTTLENGALEGRWVNAKRDRVSELPFSARPGIAQRFDVATAPTASVDGRHRLLFNVGDSVAPDTAILVLNQTKHLVHGSILTETGDYRFLEGVVRNDSLLLSTMDGTHGYLLKAKIEGDELIGIFKAGKHWRQAWKAQMNTPHRLSNPESMTTLTNDQPFGFSFPDIDGNTVSLADERFRNKVMLVSVMGTWCSNCLDEVRFLKYVAERYSADDIRVVGLNYELVSDSAQALENMRRYKTNLEINFPILLAATATTKSKAGATLPSLNGIFSYPTLIVLNRQHEVVKIHTGFSGPATGSQYYDKFRRKYLSLVDSLIQP